MTDLGSTQYLPAAGFPVSTRHGLMVFSIGISPFDKVWGTLGMTGGAGELLDPSAGMVGASATVLRSGFRRRAPVVRPGPSGGRNRTDATRSPRKSSLAISIGILRRR